MPSRLPRRLRKLIDRRPETSERHVRAGCTLFCGLLLDLWRWLVGWLCGGWCGGIAMGSGLCVDLGGRRVIKKKGEL